MDTTVHLVSILEVNVALVRPQMERRHQRMPRLVFVVQVTMVMHRVEALVLLVLEHLTLIIHIAMGVLVVQPVLRAMWAQPLLRRAMLAVLVAPRATGAIL